MTATVSPVSPATGTPTGSVTFMDGVTALGTVPLVGGSASLSTSSLSVGSHSLTAIYNGSATLNGSTSSAVTQTVNAAAPVTINTSTNLTASATTIRPAFFITFTATVTADSGTPTGTVSFFDGSALLGTVQLNASGQASLITRRLQSLGDHSITAVYNGAGAFLGSTSPVVTVTVIP